MQTRHEAVHGDARDLSTLTDESVQLIVTSPPYPMIAMWDEAFTAMDPEVGLALDRAEGVRAFEAMHRQLDRCWAELHRVLVPGGLACINIGDATRSVDKQFALWPNHARILQAALALGFTVLPDILWRKPNNSPTKFMGSGMLPAGAYVTYEHEYVLILRKGAKRAFDADGKRHRRASALFWEERNAWYCDLWDLTGTRQSMPGVEARKRSAAFPFELAFRLIQMHSVYGDRVLDPFAGTGTTALAAAVAGRGSVMVEREESLLPEMAQTLALAPSIPRIEARLQRHLAFVAERVCKHGNPRFGPVVTRQEQELRLWRCASVTRGEARYVELEGCSASAASASVSST